MVQRWEQEENMLGGRSSTCGALVAPEACMPGKNSAKRRGASREVAAVGKRNTFRAPQIYSEQWKPLKALSQGSDLQG